MDGNALLAPTDDPGVEEDAQVLGDVLLRGARTADELVHRQLLLAQQLEQTNARRLADRAKPVGDELDDLLGKRMCKCHARNSFHNHVLVESWNSLSRLQSRP